MSRRVSPHRGRGTPDAAWRVVGLEGASIELSQGKESAATAPAPDAPVDQTSVASILDGQLKRLSSTQGTASSPALNPPQPPAADASMPPPPPPPAPVLPRTPSSVSSAPEVQHAAPLNTSLASRYDPTLHPVPSTASAAVQAPVLHDLQGWAPGAPAMPTDSVGLPQTPVRTPGGAPAPAKPSPWGAQPATPATAAGQQDMTLPMPHEAASTATASDRGEAPPSVPTPAPVPRGRPGVLSPFADVCSPVFGAEGIGDPVFYGGGQQRAPTASPMQMQSLAPAGAGFCGNCGLEVTPGDRFCRGCGKQLPATASRGPSQSPNMSQLPQRMPSASAGRGGGYATAGPMTPASLHSETVPGDYSHIAEQVPEHYDSYHEVNAPASPERAVGPMSVLQRSLAIEKESGSGAGVVTGMYGAKLEMPRDHLPVVPPNARNLRSQAWQRHPGAMVIRNLLAWRGIRSGVDAREDEREYVEKFMTRPFLDAIAKCLSGAYFLRYDRERATRENWCCLSMLADHTRPNQLPLPYFCYATHANSRRFRERMCLTRLIGVQMDNAAPGFLPSLINKDYIYCPSNSNRKRPVSAKNCFTLWFNTGEGDEGVTDVNLLNQHDEVFHAWTHVLSIIRSMNCERNYTNNKHKKPVLYNTALLEDEARKNIDKQSRVIVPPAGRLHAQASSPRRFRNSGI